MQLSVRMLAPFTWWGARWGPNGPGCRPVAGRERPAFDTRAGPYVGQILAPAAEMRAIFCRTPPRCLRSFGYRCHARRPYHPVRCEARPSSEGFDWPADRRLRKVEPMASRTAVL